MADLIPTRFVSARLSCDEGQYAWIAEFELANIESYARTQIGDVIELDVMGEIFRLRVDNRTIDRELGAERYVISAMSPLGFLDAPWAAETTIHYPDPINARSAVEAILSSAVHWHLPAWTIPAGALSMANITPLQAVREIVEAIGGVIESLPNGEIICRLRDPINVPDYGTAVVDHYLGDSDWIALSSDSAPAKGFNRVMISNSTAALSGNTDKLEVIPDAVDGSKKLIRAYLSAQRPVDLVHTGSAATVIISLGVVTRTESEVIEFVAGKATLKYPAQALVSLVWQHADIGTVSLSGSTATSSVADGYSLAAVSYTVQTTDWQVSLPITEEVQFILVEAS